jgi:NADH:ubiquinone oxidoreductase subunit 5 (subunit L)/multisubunit Na+/H+ antiporter MnhA subunit/multisubunit Na+/H+ antiporter MnhB subunit
MAPLLILILPLLAVLVIGVGHTRLKPAAQGLIAAAFLLVGFVIGLLLLSGASAEAPLRLNLPWIPSLGLQFSLYIDGLALVFMLLICGIGTAVMAYAGYYFTDSSEDDTEQGKSQGEAARFLALLLAFTAAMLLLVTAGNLLVLFIAWEATSILSFLLISFKGASEAARRGASQALLITGGGGLALLVGLLLLGTAAGSFEWADILADPAALAAHPWYGGIFILIAAAAFTKSAQFPVHFWLPGAMSAPTPASAFLHSATMVKAGIYLLARCAPVLGGTAAWESVLPAFGLATLAVGAVLAIRQRDLKAMLAFSTVSQLGALVALIGWPGGEGLKAALVGVIAHGLYKCTLFLMAGAVDHAAGTRDIFALGGLRRVLPGWAAVTGIAALSMAGVPPLLGFVSKELLIEEALTHPFAFGTAGALVVVVVSAALTVAVAARLYWDVFEGARTWSRDAGTHHTHAHDADAGAPALHALPPLMLAGPALLAAASVVFGLFVGVLLPPLVGLGVGEPVTLYLFPPYGITPALITSGVALILGAAVFADRAWWLGLPLRPLFTGGGVFRAFVGLIERAGDLLLTTQGGRIRYYLAVINGVVVVLVMIALIPVASSPLVVIEPIALENASEVLKAVLLMLSLVATGASIVFERHLLAALSLSLAGYAIGGIFLLEPAPDVALVQFLVETLATVLIIIILARTSAEERQRVMERLWGYTRVGLARDIAIASAAGVAMGLFALFAVNSRPTPNSIAIWYLENALPQVGVTDVVAGIVTDFRGTDTVIEITVFGIAALGVLTLLARPKPGKVTPILGWHPSRRGSGPKDALEQDSETPEPPTLYQSRFTDPITQVAALLGLPFAFIIALAHLLYAGVAPGDGFTAGVIAGLAITLWYVVFGYEATKAQLRWLHPAQFIGAGLMLALVNALLPIAFGREFLAFTQLPISIADVKFASTLVFEAAIALTVFGGISTITEAISHPREAEPL